MLLTSSARRPAFVRHDSAIQAGLTVLSVPSAIGRSGLRHDMDCRHKAIQIVTYRLSYPCPPVTVFTENPSVLPTGSDSYSASVGFRYASHRESETAPCPAYLARL